MSEEKGLLSFVKKLVFGNDNEDKNKPQNGEGGTTKRKHRRNAKSKKKRYEDDDEVEDLSPSPSSSSPESSSSQDDASDDGRKHDRRTARSDKHNGKMSTASHKRNGVAASAPSEPPATNRKLPLAEPETTGSSSSASNQSDDDPLTSALLKFKGKLIQSMERSELQTHLETLGLSALGSKPELITRLSHAVLALKGEKSVLVDDMAKVKAPLATLSGGIPQERYERLRRLLMSRVQREDDQVEDSYAPRMPSTVRDVGTDMSFTDTQQRQAGYVLGEQRHLMSHRASTAPYSARHNFVPGSAKRTSDAAFGGIPVAYQSPHSTLQQPKRTREMFYDESERLNRSTMSARAPGSVLKRPRDFMSGSAAFASPTPPSADEVAKRILSTLGKLATPIEEPSAARPGAAADLLLSKNRPSSKLVQQISAATPSAAVSSRPFTAAQETTRADEPPSKHQRIQLQQEDISPVSSRAPAAALQTTPVQGSPVPPSPARGASAVKPRFAFSPAAASGKPKNLAAPTPDELSKYSFEGSPVQQEGWICKACGVDNEASNNLCSLCRVKKGEENKAPASALKASSSFGKKEESKTAEASRPATTSSAKPAENVFAKFQMKPTQWKCPTCSVPNENTSPKCVSCETENPNKASSTNASTASKPGSVAPGENVFAKFQLKPNQWKCPTCSVFNENSSLKCVSCETDKPDASGVAGTAVAAEAGAGEGKKVKFGETRSEFVISGDKVLPVAEKAPLVNAKTEKTPGKAFGEAVVGSTPVAPAFTFSGPTTTEASKPTFSFDQPSGPASILTDGKKPAFSFGGSTSASTSSSEAIAQPAAFSFGSAASAPGLSSSSGEAAKPAFSFGSAAGAPPAATSLLSTSSYASVPSASAATPSLFSFGGGATSMTGTEPPVKKKEALADQFASTQPVSSLFAPAAASTTEAKAAPSFSFGASQPSVASTGGTGGSGSSIFSFGAPSKPTDVAATSGTAPPPSVSPGLPVAPPSDNLARTSSVTSQSSATSANPTPPPFTFGATQPAAAPSSNTMAAGTPFTFGGPSSSTVATDPNKPFQFGSAVAAAQSQRPFAFGGGAPSTATTAAAPVAGASAPLFANGGSQMFSGAANAPGPSMFNGTPANNSAPTGPAPSSFSFGAPAGPGGSMFAAPTAATTSVFGGIGGQPSQQQAQVGGFGSNAGSGMFANAGTANSGFPPAATPTPPPTFGASGTTPQFGFSGANAPAGGGFGGGGVFGAPGGTAAGGFGGAPQFGGGGFGMGATDSATSGMFSMGSSASSAQKKRAVRPGKRG